MSNSMQVDKQKITSALADTSHHLGKQVGETVSTMSGKATDAYSKSCDYVKENPVKGVAMAAVAGMALGSILMKRGQ
jgi:ElaB/YqjD/DUF883 family membrane-anchored ribosome-binding protein